MKQRRQTRVRTTSPLLVYKANGLDGPRDDSSDPEGTAVIGWDPGERHAVVMSSLDSKSPNRRHTVKITRSYLWRPAVRFRQDLEDQKAPQEWQLWDGISNVTELESNMPNLMFPTMDRYFSYVRSSTGIKDSNTLASSPCFLLSSEVALQETVGRC